MKAAVALLVALLCLTRVTLAAADIKVNDAVAKDTRASLAKGAAWFVKNQNPDGSWGAYKVPAIAALAAMSLSRCPSDDPAATAAAVDKALAYVLKFQQPNGAIYQDDGKGGGYAAYSTSIVLTMLATINRPGDVETMKKARAYLQSIQFADPSKVDYGGIGYGKSGNADLSNLSWAAEALHATEYLTKEPFTKDAEAPKQDAEMWSKMQQFLTKCQNLPETNKADWVSTNADDQGGFVYRPGNSMAGSRDGEGKTTNLISEGSMTYAGLMSMIYAHVERQDVRVKGILSYLQKHYSASENPGVGQQGRYYYLHVMAKALAAYGDDVFTTADGTKHEWRAELVKTLAGLQKDDGSWVNPEGRWMENSPELVTAYAMLTLKRATGVAAE